MTSPIPGLNENPAQQSLLLRISQVLWCGAGKRGRNSKGNWELGEFFVGQHKEQCEDGAAGVSWEGLGQPLDLIITSRVFSNQIWSYHQSQLSKLTDIRKNLFTKREKQVLSHGSTGQSSEMKPISVSFLQEHKWKTKIIAYRWQSHSVLQILLLHLFKVSSQNLYKETILESGNVKGLERTFKRIWCHPLPWAGTCRKWDRNIKDGKMGILVYLTGLLWGHREGKTCFQAQTPWF